MFLFPTNSTKVLEGLSIPKLAESVACHGISMERWRSSCHVVVPIPVLLMNWSVEEEIFLELVKLAEVVPLFDKREKDGHRNYRIFSFFPVSSKMF